MELHLEVAPLVASFENCTRELDSHSVLEGTETGQELSFATGAQAAGVS